MIFAKPGIVDVELVWSHVLLFGENPAPLQICERELRMSWNVTPYTSTQKKKHNSALCIVRTMAQDGEQC